MKKILLFLCLSTLTLGYSQEKEVAVVKEEEVPSFKKNELKGNALFLIIGAVEVTYERILDEDSGVGLTFFVAYDDNNFNMKYNVTPYYRFYFGNKPAAGFFLSGFAMYNQFEDYCYECDYDFGGYDEYGNYYPYNNDKKVSNNFALGIGVGAKWVVKKGFIVEISSGIGRNIYKSNDYAPDFVGLGGVNLGYRF